MRCALVAAKISRAFPGSEESRYSWRNVVSTRCGKSSLPPPPPRGKCSRQRRRGKRRTKQYQLRISLVELIPIFPASKRQLFQSACEIYATHTVPEQHVVSNCIANFSISRAFSNLARLEGSLEDFAKWPTRPACVSCCFARLRNI